MCPPILLVQSDDVLADGSRREAFGEIPHLSGERSAEFGAREGGEPAACVERHRVSEHDEFCEARRKERSGGDIDVR